MEALRTWVEKGFERLARIPVHKGCGRCSWRLMARTAREKEALCGLLKDSADAVGRRYPLLVAGCGPLADWDTHWPAYPLALGDMWERLEFVCGRRYTRLAELGEAVKSLPAPCLKHPPAHGSLPGGKRLDRCGPGVWEVDLSLEEDVAAILTAALEAARLEDGLRPHAVFVGGTQERCRAVVFERALATADFEVLWSGI